MTGGDCLRSQPPGLRPYCSSHSQQWWRQATAILPSFKKIPAPAPITFSYRSRKICEDGAGGGGGSAI